MCSYCLNLIVILLVVNIRRMPSVSGIHHNTLAKPFHKINQSTAGLDIIHRPYSVLFIQTSNEESSRKFRTLCQGKCSVSVISICYCNLVVAIYFFNSSAPCYHIPKFMQRLYYSLVQNCNGSLSPPNAVVIVNNNFLPPHHLTIRTGYLDSSDSFLATLPKKFNFDRPFDCNFLLPTTII